MSETIKCGNCGNDSGIERVENNGTNAAQIQHIGWIPKLPVLVGITEWLFSCSPECKSKLFAKKRAEYGVSNARVSEAAKIVSEVKKNIPQMTAETCSFIGKLQKTLKGGNAIIGASPKRNE